MRIFVILIIIVALSPLALAGWNEPVLLTPNHVYSSSIVANGNYVYSMSPNWPDGRILYFKSTDYGQTWGTVPQFADTVQDSGYSPRLTVRDSVVCAVWANSVFVSLGISSNNGETWRFKTNILGLFYDDLGGYCPGLIDYRPYLLCNRTLPYEEGAAINFNVENVSDTTWQTPVEIIPTYGALDISTAYYNNVIHCLSLASNNDRWANCRTIYFRSTNNGATWSNPIYIESDSMVDVRAAKLAMNERGEIVVGYMNAHGYDSTSIAYRTSGDNGLTWSAEIQLTNVNLYENLSVGWGGNTVAFTYTLNTGFHTPTDLYCQISNDNGATWLPEFRLTNDSAYTRYPDVAVSNDTVYVVYYSQSQPGVIDQGLYFRRYDPEPQRIRDNTAIPNRLTLTAYPNPFNSSCYIKFAIPIQSHVIVDVYNIVGQKVATLLNEQQQAGEHTVVFNANNLGSGLYFYRLTAGDFSETKSLVLIK